VIVEVCKRSCQAKINSLIIRGVLITRQRTKNIKQMKKKIGELFFQIIPVMIGVFLGFQVSNWSDKKQQNSKKKIFRTNIINEIKENKKNVLSVIEYHKMLKDSSRYYLNSNKPTMVSYFNGIKSATLLNSAFETGIQTGLLNELSIDEIQSLNRVYQVQNSLNDINDIMFTGLVSMDLRENEESAIKIIHLLSYTMEDIWITESKLLSDYENILSTIQNQN